MAKSNYPHGFEHGITIRNKPVDFTASGNIFWVGKTPEGQAGSDGYNGTYNWPFATIDFAIGKCTANHGDIIFVKAGHTETLSSAGAIAADVAGISIIGLGSGADRPTLTFGTLTTASFTISAASVTIENIIGKSALDALANPFNITGNDCWLDIEWRDASDTVEAARAVQATTVSDLFAKLRYVGFVTGNACVNAINLVAVTGARILIDAYGEFSTGIVEMVTTASTDVRVDGTFYNDNVALTKNVVNTGGLACTWSVSGYDAKGGYYFSGGSAAAVAADDVGSVGTQVSVVDSRIIAASTTAVDSVGVQVSTVDSRLIATTTTAVDSVGVQVSTTDSRLIVADAAVDSVGVQTSTADSRLLATTSSVGTQVSTTDSRLIVAAALLTTAEAEIDSVGVQVSITDSRLIATTTTAVDSVGVQVSVTDSRLIVAGAAVDSTGVQVSTTDSRLIVAGAAIDSVGVQTSTADSRLLDTTSSIGTQASTADSRLIVADAAVDSVGIQVSTVDSRIVATTTTAITSVGTQVSVTDSRVIVASAAVDSVGVQVSTTDSRVLATTGSIGTQVSATDSRLIVADAAVDSVGVQVSVTDSRLMVASAAVDSVGVQVSTTDSRLIVCDAAVDSVGVQVSTADSRIYYQSKRGASKSVASITTANLFTVAGGCVKILNIVGYITTAIQDAANNTKLVMTPTGGTATDICAVLNVQNSGQYGLLTITGTFANAMVLTATAGVKAGIQAAPFITSPGILSLNCAATTTGGIDWYIEYVPMDADAIIT